MRCVGMKASSLNFHRLVTSRLRHIFSNLISKLACYAQWILALSAVRRITPRRRAAARSAGSGDLP